MVYRVIQVDTKKRYGTVWCTTESFDFLLGFCQFMIDSAYDGKLTDFRVYENTEGTPFYEFCERWEIRRRTFEERMEGNPYDRRAREAWAESRGYTGA